MERSPLFSDIQVDSVRVSECTLWTNQEPPSGQLATNTNIELSNPSIRPDIESGSPSTPMFLCLTVSYSDDDDAQVPRARISVKMTGRAIAQGDAVMSDDDARVATVSQLYPQAQSYISVLGSIAGISGVSTPTVDAGGVVAALKTLGAAGGAE